MKAWGGEVHNVNLTVNEGIKQEASVLAREGAHPLTMSISHMGNDCVF